MKRLSKLCCTLLLLAAAGSADAAPTIHIVAAENFYGDVARQIGGPRVEVSSVLANPEQDPHLFEASPSVVRTVSAAQIVIYNGIGYDPWMATLLSATHAGGRHAIVVAALVGRRSGDNPHLWYSPATMPALGTALASVLSDIDPAHRNGYEGRLAVFRRSLQPLQARIDLLRRRLAGLSVTATEPVAGYLLDALGATVKNREFQRAVMNGTEPSASDIAAFEHDLVARRVRLLVYNRQASSPVAARMRKLAESSHVPVVGVSETEPTGKSYQAWMLETVNAIDRAIPG